MRAEADIKSEMKKTEQEKGKTVDFMFVGNGLSVWGV